MGLVGVDVGQLGRQSLVDDRGCRTRTGGGVVAHPPIWHAGARLSRPHRVTASVTITARRCCAPSAVPLDYGPHTCGAVPHRGGGVASELDRGWRGPPRLVSRNSPVPRPRREAGLHAGHGGPGARLGQRHRRRPAGRDRGRHRRRHGRRRLRQRGRRASCCGAATTTATSSTPSSTRSPTSCGGGAIWLLTPKIGRPNAVDAADITEAAPIAGLAQTTTAAVSKDWSATRLVAPKSP